MDYELMVLVLPIAFGLDLLLGDPRWIPHPIRGMGRAIEWLEPRFRILPVSLVLSGGLMAVVLIVTAGLVTTWLCFLAHHLHPVFGTVVEIVFIWYAISCKSLEREAMAVHDCLLHGTLMQARHRVAMIVGRETDGLSEKGVARATVETVAENLVDGVISPLFWAAIGGAPLAMAFKMASTLDSMVGYKNETYFQFGKIAARIDDVANYLPARLSVLMISVAAELLGRRGGSAWETALKEGHRHASPNAGRPEAAFAGALGVRLLGPARYHGRLVDKPYIGVNLGEVSPRDIIRACDLMFLTSLVWLGCIWLATFFF